MNALEWVRNLFSNEDDDEQEVIQTPLEETEQEAPKPRQKERRDMSSNTGKPEFVVVKPDKFDESVQIGTYLLERKTVVLNLESTGKDQARRIVDFLTGIAFALGGKLKQVSLATYIIIPSNAEISGVDMEVLENSGMYF